jgi:hypothetical protein
MYHPTPPTNLQPPQEEGLGLDRILELGQAMFHNLVFQKDFNNSLLKSKIQAQIISNQF